MTKLNDTQKREISENLRTYVGRYSSQNKAANSLKGVSSATVSSILNGNWALISDEMWMKVQSQIFSSRGWQLYETVAHQSLMLYFLDSQEESSVVWITGPAGIGKSTAAAQYAESHKNVFLLTCRQDFVIMVTSLFHVKEKERRDCCHCRNSHHCTAHRCASVL